MVVVVVVPSLAVFATVTCVSCGWLSLFSYHRRLRMTVRSARAERGRWMS